MLGVTEGALVFPPAGTPGLSAYLTSKLAMVKTLEFLAAENPSIFVASVHPGMVDTGIFRKSGAKPEMLPMDSGEFFDIPLTFGGKNIDRSPSYVLIPHDNKSEATLFLLLQNLKY